jgi:predicted ATPase
MNVENSKMRFVVVPNSGSVPSEGRSVGFLLTDNWNDWGKFQTMYYLTYFDDEGQKHDIGSVKIGQFQMEKDQSRPGLPTSFEGLDERFFSVGQDADYYTNVMKLGTDVATEFLSALKDIAADEELYARALEEEVTGTSLLRDVNMRTIEVQYRRIIAGGVELTEYSFRYTSPAPEVEGSEALFLDFEVIPESLPPTNLHVLIGTNGVGKTRLLNSMTRAIVEQEPDVKRDGSFSISNDIFEEGASGLFGNIVSVSFSAFDDFQEIRKNRNATKGFRYTNIGLRKRIKNSKGERVVITRDPEELASDFSSSAKLCSRGTKAERWRKALSTLEADPLFAEAEVANLVDLDKQSFGREARKLYRRLSSGHKIVLLTITKLIETVEEKTLVLMDEPEAHLHPPLLAAFLGALSDLLTNRNGVAIIATHSPVVLQEVPLSCAWKVVRHGHASKATRLDIESFAESTGILTREVFGLEVTRSGFHKMLGEAAADEQRISDVLDKFDNEVGSEGRALISAMISNNKRDEQ